MLAAAATRTIRALARCIMSSAGDAEYQVVDVFTDRPYSGNPTCVCFLEGAGDAWMSKFAMESNQPTTSLIIGHASLSHSRDQCHFRRAQVTSFDQ